MASTTLTRLQVQEVRCPCCNAAPHTACLADRVRNRAGRPHNHWERVICAYAARRGEQYVPR
jgi:hypothetical protein